jgi:hypothetical protein
MSPCDAAKYASLPEVEMDRKMHSRSAKLLKLDAWEYAPLCSAQVLRSACVSTESLDGLNVAPPQVR